MVTFRALIGVVGVLSLANAGPTKPLGVVVRALGQQPSSFSLQRRGGAFSSFWWEEQFEPTTSEPTHPFDPPRPLDETLDFLRMQMHDPGAQQIVEFHRNYDKVLDPATLPPRLARKLAREYQKYQRFFPVRGQDTRAMSMDQAIQHLRSDVTSNRIAGMKHILNQIERHAGTLRLDPIRRGYLAALKSRFEEDLSLLYPSDDAMEFSKRFGDPKRPMRAAKYAEWEKNQKTARIEGNLPLLHQDHDLLVKLEIEFDELVRKTLQAGPHNVRRSAEDPPTDGRS